MKTFTIVVSRYNSTRLDVQADTIEEAKEIIWWSAHEYFDDFYNEYEIVDAYEKEQ